MTQTTTSRRAFLSVTGATAASVWIPQPVKGYAAAEMRAVNPADVGISKWELDTPALCVDLDHAGAEHREDAGHS